MSEENLKSRNDKFVAYISEIDLRWLPESESAALSTLLESSEYIDRIFLRQKSQGFYPLDFDKNEFFSFISKNPRDAAGLESPFTIINRGLDGGFDAVPFHVEYSRDVKGISKILAKAAGITKNKTLARYLKFRSEAVLSDDYTESDKAWLDVSDSSVDAVVGPYETYDDCLTGLKASYEGIFMVVDPRATKELSCFQGHARELEEYLPVAGDLKKTVIGKMSPIGVYNVTGLAGQANAGIKAIAASLPNDEKVRQEKGAKTLIFKNVMKAKFDSILMPIACAVLKKETLEKVNFEAFFRHSLLHELAHPLGLNYVKNRDGNVPVRKALKERYSTIEECKADILGLYSIGYFVEKGILNKEDEIDAYYTQLASIFRSARFGTDEDHAKASVIQFNYFREKGAVIPGQGGESFSVDFACMKSAVKELGTLLLKIEGEGDYDGAGRLIVEKSRIPPEMESVLKKLTNVPVDVEMIFKPVFK